MNLPATVGLIVLAVPIVALIFEHGRFTAADTVATARALQFYAIGLVAYSVVRIVSPAFYALRSSRVPVVASVISVVVNIALNVVLVRVMGFAGLALGTSLAAIVNAAVQLMLLRRHLQGIEGRRVTVTFVKVVTAAVAMGVGAWYAELLLRNLFPGASVPRQAARLAATIVVALAILTAAAAALRLREFHDARDVMLGRFRRLSR